MKVLVLLGKELLKGVREDEGRAGLVEEAREGVGRRSRGAIDLVVALVPERMQG